MGGDDGMLSRRVLDLERKVEKLSENQDLTHRSIISDTPPAMLKND